MPTVPYLYQFENQSLFRLIEARQRGELSACEVLQAALGALNGVELQRSRIEQAKTEAIEFDRAYPPGSWMPALAGVPIIVDDQAWQANGSPGADREFALPPGTAISALAKEGALVVGSVLLDGVSATLGAVVDQGGANDQSCGANDQSWSQDPLLQSHLSGAIKASLVAGDLLGMLWRARCGLASYRPTLGLTPARSPAQGRHAVSFLAATIPEQAFLLDRLRARGVSGDPRYLPHSEPKSLLSFAVTPKRPDQLGVLEMSADPGSRTNAQLLRSQLFALGIRVEEAQGAPFSKLILEANEVDQPGGYIGATDALLFVRELDRWLAKVGAMVVVLGPAGDGLREIQIVAELLEAANLPWLIPGGGGSFVVGGRFDDAQLLRLGAFLHENGLG
ncbi:hypothetical protein [Ferrimicrobium sp.]|uniref:hypothetical protein n=1 Tax=Ferrimicrobium sp. TaxID=2926050 RepID=UPI00261FD343|nr:hypothetical protein [Ferrimicrobium sp.]